MIRKNSDGTTTSLTLPNHKQIKSSTLRSICTQAGISRDDFIASYEKTWLFVTLYAKSTDKMPRQHTSNPKIPKVSKAIGSPFY